MKRWKIVVAAAAVACVPAGCVTYIASQVNSQGEYSDASGHLSPWLLLTNVFVWYFAPAFVLILGLCSPALFRKRSTGGDISG